MSMCSAADRTCLAALDDSQNQDARKGRTGRGQQGFWFVSSSLSGISFNSLVIFGTFKSLDLISLLSWHLPLALKLLVCNLFP